MERARANGKREIVWPPEVDRILVVGMKHGRQGVREATNRVLLLAQGLTRADCWKRLRSLRENANGNYPPPRNWPAEIRELLREGYGAGGKKKREALKAVRKLYPGLPSNSSSRFARRQGWIPLSSQLQTGRPWTEYEQRKLWELAGYEPVARIAERLGRSEGAVRFRLKSQGLSAKVKDGWSFRGIQEMLHLGPSKLRRLIVQGALRVRDARITAESLAALRESRLASSTTPAVTQPHGLIDRLRPCRKTYSWGSAAKVLGAAIEQVHRWIINGDLKMVDGFVTERAFQDFCKKHGSELNSSLLGADVRDWLVEGYSLSPNAPKDATATAGNQKHALVVRRCRACGRQMRGNVFFRHVKNCKAPANTRPNVYAQAAVRPDLRQF